MSKLCIPVFKTVYLKCEKLQFFHCTRQPVHVGKEKSNK